MPVQRKTLAVLLLTLAYPALPASPTPQAVRAAGSLGLAAKVVEAARNQMLKAPEAKLDYVALVDADTFEPVTDGFSGRAILLIAAVVGETRLIDNIEITF